MDDININYIFILHSEFDIEKLYYNISLVQKQNPKWIGVVVNSDFPESRLVDVSYQLNKYGISFDVSKSLIAQTDEELVDTFYYNIPKNGWTVINIVGEYLNLTAKTIIEKYISNDRISLLYIHNDSKSINNVCFSNFIYDNLGGYCYPDENNTIGLKEKIQLIYSGQEYKCIHEWKNL